LNRQRARDRMIDEFIHQNLPGRVRKTTYWLMGVGWPCTGWHYEPRDLAAHREAYDAILSVYENPYEFDD
jgi:hypothetical protein